MSFSFRTIADSSKGISSAEALAQVTQFGRQLCYTLFLTTDTLVWLQSARVLRLDKE